jgi:DNA-directed RNA polymerase specialized sigma24 family protein
MNRPAPSPLPSPADGRSLHRRLCAGDKVAVTLFSAAYLEPLIIWLEATNRRVDPHLCQQAAEDAVLSVLKNPSCYDPTKLDPFAFLCMAAKGDLKNALKRDQRQRRGEKNWSAVELSPQRGKYLGRDDDPSLRLRIAEGPDGTLPPADAAVRASLTGPEQEVFDLMLRGERDNSEFAKVLGLADRPVAEQRREVKRVKDRIKKRRERRGGGDGHPT